MVTASMWKVNVNPCRTKVPASIRDGGDTINSAIEDFNTWSIPLSEQSIQSEDMTLKRVFQDFYRVPDYQREYVWGEVDLKGQRGDEVEQYLKDIHAEFENAVTGSAPEYFIGSVVVCPGADDIYDLIDGQQRITTSFLTLCAIRDLLSFGGDTQLNDLQGQIFAVNRDWEGNIDHRFRLDLQYEDSRGVLAYYAKGHWDSAPSEGTRSIANIFAAYQTIREFLRVQFQNDASAVRRFYGYFTNKVKLIRIQTSSVAKALKIFETVNDRGVGLDAMDLLKNLLFMNASANEFGQLKNTWKAITDTIYKAREKPLRFLRYFLLATYEVDEKLQEDTIYDWFLRNPQRTGHTTKPSTFANDLLDAARAYAAFVDGQNPRGQREEGIVNTRFLGGSAVRQHYILLLAGRRLDDVSFSRLALEIEKLMFVYLITNTLTKEYERSITEGARKLRTIASNAEFERFCDEYFPAAKRALSAKFDATMLALQLWDVRAFRARYLLAKLTQYIDVCAYGSDGGRGTLANYFGGKNDIEHILPATPSKKAIEEFGEETVEAELPQKFGNLVLIERTLNQLLGNKPYSDKIQVYPNSTFLLAKCLPSRPIFGVNDQITRTVSQIPIFPSWNRDSIRERQKYMAALARQIWEMPAN